MEKQQTCRVGILVFQELFCFQSLLSDTLFVKEICLSGVITHIEHNKWASLCPSCCTEKRVK